MRDIPETELLPDGQGERVLKIYSLLVFQEVGQLMNAILHTMARLKHKVRHENFLFGLKILYSFCWGEGGEGLQPRSQGFSLGDLAKALGTRLEGLWL